MDITSLLSYTGLSVFVTLILTFLKIKDKVSNKLLVNGIAIVIAIVVSIAANYIANVDKIDWLLSIANGFVAGILSSGIYENTKNTVNAITSKNTQGEA